MDNDTTLLVGASAEIAAYIQKLRKENRGWRVKLQKALADLADLRAKIGLNPDQVTQ